MKATEAVEVIDSFTGNYRWLSNFWEDEHPIQMWIEFPTAEHLYNSLKTSDLSEAMWVANAATPDEAKRRGQQVTLKKDWDTSGRLPAMRQTLGAKFFQNALLRSKLLCTEDAWLVEGNTWHDQFWGDCRCGRAACSEPGQNWLGRLLMELRSDLRKWS